jgi:hypothetical protein
MLMRAFHCYEATADVIAIALELIRSLTDQIFDGLGLLDTPER